MHIYENGVVSYSVPFIEGGVETTLSGLIMPGDTSKAKAVLDTEEFLAVEEKWTSKIIEAWEDCQKEQELLHS